MRSSVIVAAAFILIIGDDVPRDRSPIDIAGTVIDLHDNPIPGVIVLAWWGRDAKSTTTDSQGAYRLTIDPGRPVTTLYYDKRGENWALAHIQYLSGLHNHSINKVLHQANPGRLALAPGLEALSAYENIYYQSGGGETGLPEGAADRYRRFLAEMEFAGEPPETALERLFQVQRLWNVR